MQTIAVVQQKGGTGKSTSTINLASAFAKKGYRTLVVDLDPQGALSTALGFAPDALTKTLYEVWFDGLNVKNAIIVREDLKGLALLPSNVQMVKGEMLLIAGEMAREQKLKETLEEVADDFDFAFIDTPPSFLALTTNALVAANYCLVPVSPDYLSMRGMENLLEFVMKVKRAYNPDLKILGIIVNMADMRTTHSKEAIEILKNIYGKHVKVFETTIRYTTRIKDSYAAKTPIVFFDEKAMVAKDYMKLAEEILNKLAEEG